MLHRNFVMRQPVLADEEKCLDLIGKAIIGHGFVHKSQEDHFPGTCF